MKTTVLHWTPAPKVPRCKATDTSVSLSVGRGMSHTEKMPVRDSAPILMRFAELPKRLVNGFQSGGSEPNPRTGLFTYRLGYFRRYEDGECAFEDTHGYETGEPDAWAYLPRCADYR